MLLGSLKMSDSHLESVPEVKLAPGEYIDPEEERRDTIASGKRIAMEDINDNRQTCAQMTSTEKVRTLLTREDQNISLESKLFCQLDALVHFNNGDVAWKEVARWLKYEEKVEEGNRWSKPHVSTTSLRQLIDVRNKFRDGAVAVCLDIELSDSSTKAMAESLTEAISNQQKLSTEERDQVMNILMQPHKHKHRHGEPPKRGKLLEKGKEEEASVPGFMPVRYPSGLGPSDLKSHQPNKRLSKKIAKGTETANILIGECEFLNEPVFLMARLNKATQIGDMTEVDVPTRFIFLALTPTFADSPVSLEFGRALGALFSDTVLCNVAYKARNADDMADGIDDFIDGLTVLPPSLWDPATRLEPPHKTLDQSKLVKRLESYQTDDKAGIPTFEHGGPDPTLIRTGRLFGGMIEDAKRRYSLYFTDFKDALHIQCIASIFFLYFACITPIITFGGLLGDGTGNNLGTMETIVSGALCGLVYAIFSGQPLTIVGATGPMLIFETLLYSFSTSKDIDFLAFRFWIGIWVTVILLLFVAFDLSSLVQYITRFSEESFSVLISLIFIMEAFKKVFKIWNSYPVGLHTDENLNCYCLPSSENTTSYLGTNTTEKVINTLDNFTAFLSPDCINSKGELIISYQCLQTQDCERGGWNLNGTGCEIHNYVNMVPDVFFLSLFIFIATFTIAYKIKYFRNAPYFPSFIRTNLSDFAVLIAILICVGIDVVFGLNTPKLFVPGEFKTTLDGRGWLVDPTRLQPWYLILLAIIPAILATILIFLDQQITAVIVNRKDHKLQKSPGYHLDLFVIAILICACSVLGLPWFVAATVRSITHVNSLIKWSECSAPGDRPVMLGVREQRVTGIVIHVLIGLSILMTRILNYVPMSVLYGVFLYMGVTSLSGVQFVERVLLVITPKKYQPDTIYLRHVKTSRVHIFTAIQVLTMGAMWAVKSIGVIAIFFPIMILALCFVRKGMEYIFSVNELYWLDHLLPDATRRKREDERKNQRSVDDKSVNGLRKRSFEMSSTHDRSIPEEGKHLLQSPA